jgi:phosphoserine phosphatase
MDLILQQARLNRAEARAIAALADSRHSVETTANSMRCIGVADTPEIRAKVAAAALTAGIDATFIDGSLSLQHFRLLAMDMDSTLITIECIDEIADMHGLKPQVAAITEASMRGEIEFVESLLRRVALLRGLHVEALQRVYDERVHLSAGAEQMLEAARTAGLKTLLISGGFTFFTERLQARLGLDFAHANELEVIDGKLTGKLLGTIVDAHEKQRTVARVCAELGVGPQQAIVIGDGANDLQMMAGAGLSLAFHAKPVVRAQADAAFNFVGLDGLPLLFL